MIQGQRWRFFIKGVFGALSDLTKSQLRVLIKSNIAAISHMILAKADFDKADVMADELLLPEGECRWTGDIK